MSRLVVSVVDIELAVGRGVGEMAKRGVKGLFFRRPLLRTAVFTASYTLRMKIVINTEYGGFALSDHAKRLFRKYAAEADPCGEKPDHVIGRCFREPTDRCSAALVRVVEELGDGANQVFSTLKVVEVPDDVNWTIQDHDGAEWVAEVHRTWF